MKRIGCQLFFLLSLLSVNSCFLTLNYDIKKQFDDAGINYKKIQFYNRYKIILERVLKNDEVNAVSGKVNFANGKYYHQIIILNETPCMVEKIDDQTNIIYVKFEEGENRFLPFRLIDGKYRLDYEPLAYENYIGRLIYDSKEYFVDTGKDAYLILKSSDKVIEKKEVNILKGVKIK